MDGATLLRGLSQLLGEKNSSNWMDTKLCYDCLFKAAVKTVGRTNSLTTTQTLTTIANTATYNLNPNFLKLWMCDNENRYFIRYNDGTNNHTIYISSYDAIYLANNTTSVTIPYIFAIKDASAVAQITGTTTSAGTLSNSYTIFNQYLGETTLTDTATDLSGVYPGDLVHNTSDGSHGIVIATSSSTAVICALFDGINNYFSSGDSYIINPQQRYQLILDPPPSTVSHSAIVPYVYRPNPVYSYYRTYPIAPQNENALIHLGAWHFKYKDREPNYGDAFYQYWDREVREAAVGISDATRRKGYRVNFIKRANRTGSIR